MDTTNQNFASNAKANAGLTTGIIGTTLGAIAAAGGLTGIVGNLGGGGASKEVAALMAENTLLKANAHADAQNAAQMAWNARQEERLDGQRRDIDRLYGLTRLVVPNGNLNPGVGPVAVVPAPLPPAPVPPATAPDVTTLANAIAQAVVTAQKAAA